MSSEANDAMNGGQTPHGRLSGNTAPEDIRPIVAAFPRNRGPWIFGAVLVIGGALLFNALETRRAALTAPTTLAPAGSGQGVVASPPELVIPPQPGPELVYDPGWQPPIVPRTIPPAGATNPPAASTAPRGSATGRYVPPPPANFGAAAPPVAQNSWSAPPSAPQPGMGAAARPFAPGAPATLGANGSAASQAGKDRVEASRFANPATTVPKGTVIQAVLESALDSTRGGFARAIVSRDIYSFDGSRVLVQRGSRIIGEYKSDVSLGQKRILIQWQRLMRPDGVMIDLDSPSADPLGRAGLQGSVNTHFFERFAGAILQSSLDIGVQLATRAATRNDTYVLALPGNVNQATQTLQPEKIPPTVKVKQGSSVSVFVVRDLDFTGVS